MEAWCPYYLSIEEVLLDHYNIDRLRILERQKAEAPRASRVVIPHDGAFEHFAKL